MYQQQKKGGFVYVSFLLTDNEWLIYTKERRKKKRRRGNNNIYENELNTRIRDNHTCIYIYVRLFNSIFYLFNISK